MQNRKVVITDYDILTAWGLGINTNWEKLLKGETAIVKNERFSTEHFVSSFAGIIPSLNYNYKKSLVLQMLEKLEANKKPLIENPDLLILATTVGEIDFLEHSIKNKQNNDIQKSSLEYILNKTKKIFNAKKGMLISAACASSSTGVAYAANLIRTGEIQNALIVGCDAITEFIYSGFSALLALDNNTAKPFDKNRNGLTVGEGAAYIFLTSEDFAEEHNLPLNAFVSGYGMSNDANHITGPSRDGSGLANAINKALSSADLTPDDIGVISAHGTGTIYNDSTEMKAFKSVLKNPVPTYSLKGGIGHTMGAAGIIEIIIATKSFQEKIIPPTIGLEQPDCEAEGWVYKKPQPSQAKYCLSVNSGFGGINIAVIIERKLH
jgi:3-oxoacyl-(acyl-carrier-protein) synthase